MPEYFEPQIEDISEAALRERIKLKKVKASVDMFDQLLQAGTTISLETSNSLLDLLCYYGDKEPSADYHFQKSEKSEELVMDFGSDFFKISCDSNNHFNIRRVLTPYVRVVEICSET